MKTVIIAIVGPSGCGKTTLADYIERNYGLPQLRSFTTRPMREDEQQGVGHRFVAGVPMNVKEDSLAYTNIDGNHYWTEWEQLDDLPIFNTTPTSTRQRLVRACTYVIDEEGLLDLLFKPDPRRDITVLSLVIRTNDDALALRGIEAARMRRDAERAELIGHVYNAQIYNFADTSMEQFLISGSYAVKGLLQPFEHSPIELFQPIIVDEDEGDR